MTLQNGLIWQRRAYLWTDTLLTDPKTGDGIGEVSKSIIGLAWPWAAIHSGEMLPDNPHVLTERLGKMKPRNEAELIEACRSVLQQEHDEERLGRLLVAYSYRREGARMFFMSTDETAAGPAFIAHPTVQHACSHADDEWNGRFTASEFTLDEMRGFIDAQLKQPSPTVYGYPTTYGGNLIEVRVTPKGVRPTLRKAIGFQSAAKV